MFKIGHSDFSYKKMIMSDSHVFGKDGYISIRFGKKSRFGLRITYIREEENWRNYLDKQWNISKKKKKKSICHDSTFRRIVGECWESVVFLVFIYFLLYICRIVIWFPGEQYVTISNIILWNYLWYDVYDFF